MGHSSTSATRMGTNAWVPLGFRSGDCSLLCFCHCRCKNSGPCTTLTPVCLLWLKALNLPALKCFHINTSCHLHCSLPSTGKAAKHIWALVHFENSTNKAFLHLCKHAAAWDTNSSHHCPPDLTTGEKNTSKSANHSISTN